MHSEDVEESSEVPTSGVRGLNMTTTFPAQALKESFFFFKISELYRVKHQKNFHVT